MKLSQELGANILPNIIAPRKYEDRLDRAYVAIDKILALFSETLDKLEGELPMPRQLESPKDVADHWALTEDGMERIVRNGKVPGYNECLSEVRSLIKEYKAQLKTDEECFYCGAKNGEPCKDTPHD